MLKVRVRRNGGVSRRYFMVLGIALVALNVGGLLWIHQSLKGVGGPKLRVLSALPTADVDSTDRLALVFNEPVVDPSRVGKPLERRPFTIHPTPDGHWRWGGLDRLEYVLHEPLLPGRVYRLEPAADLELVTGRAVVGRSEFEYRTSPLRVLDCRIHSSDSHHVNVEMEFSQPVAPDSLLHHIRVTDGIASRDLRPRLLPGQEGRELLVRVDRPADDRLKVDLKAGLTGRGAELGLVSDAQWELDVSERLGLQSADVDSFSLARDVTVRLWFTRDLDRKQEIPPVALTPAVEGVRVSRSWRCLLLEGPFECNRRYTATVNETLLSHDGQALGGRRSVTFRVPDRDPGVRFPLDRGILSPQGDMGLDVDLANVGGIALSCWRVHANNLAAHLSGQWARETSRFLPGRTLDLDLPPNTPVTKTLDLQGVMGAEPGVYRLFAKATDCSWTGDSALITVTDLAITSKQHREGCLVWVTSLRTGLPVVGAEVAALTRNNQTLASATTGSDGSGLLRFTNDGPDGPVWFVTAQKDGDLSYLLPETRTWSLDGADVGGRKAPETYDVMLYAERGVYRPGETIHLTGVVRDAFGEIPPELPLAVQVARPDGRIVAEIPVQASADAQSMFHADFSSEEDGQLGQYRFTVTLPGGGEELGCLQTLVEAFVPVRIEVTATPSSERYSRHEQPEIKVDARYLFGQPAASLPVKIGGAWRPERFHDDEHSDFTFGSPVTGAAVNIDPVPQSLDTSGRATLKVRAPGESSAGLWRGRLSATVTEPGGRSVSANTTCLLDLMDRHIGLRAPAGSIVRTGADLPIDWVVLGGDGGPIALEVLEISLHRIEWDWTVQRVDGRAVWKTSERLIPVLERRVEPAGLEGVFEVRCEQYGRYRLRARDPQTGAASEIEWYASDFGDATEGNPTSRPGRVEIIMDRPNNRPGETARVLVRGPFPGTMLLTVETDSVVDRRVVEMIDKTVELDLPVPADLRGGAFITATIVRPVDSGSDEWLPHRAMGIARLKTDHSDFSMPLDIQAPAKARPGEQIRVTVHTTDSLDPARPARVHLWAVDEGILLTTAFRTPDPRKHFFGPQRLGVITADVFGDLLPDYKRPGSIERIGAGENEDGYYRTSPVPVRTRDAAVVWSRAVPVGPGGVATFDIDVPDLTGELRLMAVVVDHDCYGSASRALTVTAPLLVEASWPRFVAPDDRFRVPVKVFNTTAEDLSARPRLIVEGPLRVDGTGARSGEIALDPIHIDAGSAATLWVAAEGIGLGQATAQVKLEADSDNGPLASETFAKLTVRSFAPPHCTSDMLRIEAGETLSIDPSDEFAPGTGRTTVRIGAKPVVQLRPAIEQLLDYPYGCVEQTASRLLGILHAPELISLQSPCDAAAETAEEMIAAGIVRLWSMQTRSGGLAYWPGDRRPCLWGTAYAASFLVQARRNGHPVDREFTRGLVRYLQRELSGAGDEVPDDNMRALICHVLAAFDEVETGWMSRLGERLDRLDIAGRAHLAAAWYEAGRKDRAAEVLTDDTLSLAIPRTTGGRITSRTSQFAVLLQVMLDLCPDHPWIPALVECLDQRRRREGSWGTTLETAGCLAALARYQVLSKEAPSFSGAVSLPDGREIEFDHTAPAVIEIAGGETGMRIRTSGTGIVYVCVTREGLSASGAVGNYDRGLKVRRIWRDISGDLVDPTKLKVGDLVRVEITCEAPGDLPRAVENVVIVDGLAGGMEAENPRLSTSAQDGSEESALTRMECRDDRVLLFTTIKPGKTTHRYCLRAISAGVFELPSIHASCMYDPEFASVHVGGRVEIRP
jgi:alpha-2-macroglobulin